MKSKDMFKEFAQNELLPELKRLEKRRRHLLIKIPLLILTTFVLLLIPIKLPGVGILLIYLPGIISVIFLIFACDDLLRKYPADFKNTITPKILTFINPSLSYSSTDRIAKNEFKKCHLFEDHMERYEGSDLVQGRIGKTDIRLCFIRADRSKDNNESMIFQGLFMILDMNKDFQSQTLVYPNYAEKYLGPLGKILNRMDFQAGDQVQLENLEFNQSFVVYSQHPIEARYILTPNLMQRMCDLSNKNHLTPCFSFTKSTVYIAIKHFPNIINPKLFSDITTFDACCEYIDELQKIIGIVDDLNLNTRIWSKE